MVTKLGSGFYGLVVASILAGVFVAIFPFPSRFSGLRPELLCLLVVYWVVTSPQYFGVFSAWLVGLAQDVIEGVTWGGHALALAIVAYICLVAQQRIRNYSVWHQTLWVFVLVGFHQVIVNWVQSLAGYHANPMELILSATISALFWPPMSFVITRVRHIYRTH